MQNLYDTLLSDAAKTLSRIPFELLGAESKEQPIRSTNGEPTEKVEKFTQYDVEIPRGYGAISRKQASIKVLEDTSAISDEEGLSDVDYHITFSGLTISYLDPQRHAIYLRAAGYEIIDNKTGKVVSRRD